MDTTSQPNLKPFRDYDEHEVINLYAHVDGDVNKGTFVAITAADGNTNVWQSANSPATPHLGGDAAFSANTPARATILREVVQWKVDTAAGSLTEGAGSVPLGVILYDVKEENQWGEKTIFRPLTERAERQVVPSGAAIPILVRGLIKTNGFTGTPGPGSGAILSSGAGAGGAGWAQVTNGVSGNTLARVGKFLTSADADGYALLKVEL